jgi:hypothetical protein
MAVEKRCPLCQGDYKNAFAKVFSLLKRSQLLSALLWVTLTLILTNIGSFYEHSTAYGAALGIGTTKLMPSSDPLA